MAVQLQVAYFISDMFGLLIDSCSNLHVMLPCSYVGFEFGAVNWEKHIRAISAEFVMS